MKDKFLKNTLARKQKVTTVNLEALHLEIIKRKNINASCLIRELLNEFFLKQYPELYADLRKEDGENE